MPATGHIDPTAKYFPPQLMEKLEYIKSYPLTLVEAPSGFGKTTILEHFFSSRVSPAIRLYVGDFESDPPTVCWQHICRLLQQVDPVCAQRLQAAGQPDSDTIGLIGRILRELSCSEETYLWLDNYRQWDNAYAGNFLDSLARHAGKGLHVVVSTQPLPSECRRRLVHSGLFWHLQSEDLTFTLDDVDSYFRVAGLHLPESQVLQAYELTEGWIMALCLQVMCYVTQGRFEQGSMSDLMEHVFWDKLSPKEREFLLCSSVFSRFSLFQAAALSGLSPEEADRRLRQKRYFIHFDPGSRLFYPHAQLKQLLQAHFSCLAPDQQKAIYDKAGQVAEQSHDRFNTLRFYYAAGEWERLLSLPLTSYDVADVTLEDTKPMILDILEHAPDEVMKRHPQALIPLAFALFFMGENEKLLKMQGKIEAMITGSALEEKEKDALRGEIQLLLSFLQYNRISAMSAYHRRALELLDGPARLISIKSTWTFGIPSVLYLYWRETGKLDEELQEMDTCMPIYYKLTQGHGSGAEQMMRAEAALMRGRPEEALPLCYQGLFVANSRHQNSIYLCGLFLLCRAALQTGSRDELATVRQALRERGTQNTEDLCKYTLDLADGYLSLLTGHPEEVAPWISQGAISEKQLVVMSQPFAYILYGRCLLERREYPKLLGSSEHFMQLSSIFPNLLPQVYAHIYCAAALDAMGKAQEAAQRLQKALDMAMPDGLYLPFAENYSRIRPLLPLTVGWRKEAGSIAVLAAAFARPDEAPGFTFTPREEDILALLRRGMTNKEIGLTLHLSPNTVRNTVSGMLKKAGVASREQLRLL